MAVLTISREIGSEGNYIGKKIADKTGYKFVFKNEIGSINDSETYNLKSSLE